MSKVVQMPLGPRSPTRKPKPPRAALPPLSSAVDVVAELETNRDEYIGKEWFTLCSFPSYLHTSLDRVRKRVKVGPRPGVSPTVACCVHHGVGALQGHEEVQGLLALKDKIDTIEGVNAHAVDTAAAWFRAFPVGVNASLSGARRQNIALPDEVKSALNELAGDIGLTSTALATLAITATLTSQPAVLDEHRRLMERTISAFLELALLRRRGGEGMLSALREMGQW
jgi:predicted transcriptional regulator